MTGPEAVAALPDSIRIGLYDFTIQRWTPLEATARQRWGEFSSIEMRIRIQENMPTAIKAVDTFMHEVLHGVWFAAGIYDEDREERTVSATATTLAQVYRDNPWLLSWITKALHS